MYNALDIAAYVISKYWKQGKTITNLKLQKILYYIQGYSLRRCDALAFSEGIYRWPYGPVVPEVYFEYNEHRAEPIPEPSLDVLERLSKEFKKERAVTGVIDDVIEKSYGFTARQMVDMTHQETPWMRVGSNDLISVELVRSYFRSNDPLGLEAS